MKNVLIIALLIVCVLLSGTATVFGALLDYHSELLDSYQCVPEERETWQPRRIPYCDKPLWERIREGCDEENLG